MPLEELLRAGSAVPIVRWGDAVLHRPCRPVTEFGPDLWDLLATMFATNRAANGAGLAAPQVGVDLAVFIFDCEDATGRHRQGLVCNPTLVCLPNPGTTVELEGCLSYPGAVAPVARPDTATCHGQDQFGQPTVVRGTGVLARCLHHETDHTGGVVMGDLLTDAQREVLRRQHDDAAGRYPARWPATPTRDG